MRILYLIPSLDGSGGAEQAVAGLTAPLVERGVVLEVVTFHPDGDLAAQVEAGGGRVTVLAARGRAAQTMVGRAAAVRALVARRRPDLVHTTLFDADVTGRPAARLARTPVVSSLVNVAYGPEQRANPEVRPWKLEVVRWADRLTAQGVRRFHALSPHVAQVMGPRLAIPAERIDVIPRGRDLGHLGTPDPDRRRRARAGLGIDPGTPLVLAAARHEHQKGLDVLVDAWPRIRRTHPQAQLRIGGRPGSQTARLEAAAAALGRDGGLAFLGRRDDVADLLVAADAFVVPSRWEGFGSILVEAMGLGAPLVASSVGPIPEVVGQGWARLVPPDDPAALAAGVGQTLDQSDHERHQRAELARRRFAEHYSLDVVADATVAFYRRALG